MADDKEHTMDEVAKQSLRTTLEMHGKRIRKATNALNRAIINDGGIEKAIQEVDLLQNVKQAYIERLEEEFGAEAIARVVGGNRFAKGDRF